MTILSADKIQIKEMILFGTFADVSLSWGSQWKAQKWLAAKQHSFDM